jgi:hypothetical protein
MEKISYNLESRTCKSFFRFLGFFGLLGLLGFFGFHDFLGFCGFFNCFTSLTPRVLQIFEFRIPQEFKIHGIQTGLGLGPSRFGTQSFWDPVGLGYPVIAGCEALLVSDKLIGGIGTSPVKYSVGLDTIQSGLVLSVETDI